MPNEQGQFRPERPPGTGLAWNEVQELPRANLHLLRWVAFGAGAVLLGAPLLGALITIFQVNNP